MMRVGMRIWGVVCLVGLVFCQASVVYGVSLDENGEIKFGARAYTAARIGTEDTDLTIRPDLRSLTFPVSAAGHLRQHRYFVEAELDHDVRRLMKQGIGPLTLINWLPRSLQPSLLKYHVVYRGEGEGIYDYGPSAYRTAEQFFDNRLVPPGFAGPALRDRVAARDRRRLRDIAVQRHRLFQAFIDTQFGDLFLRFGRQILAWGETDSFRLLDNINPLDSSFGGFLTSLDERRVPLDMLRANYYVGTLGPLSELYIEAYGAIDDQVGFKPGVPVGSPWALPNLGAPSTTILTTREGPDRTFAEMRGGAQIKFNAPIPALGEGTFSFVHYYTYLDTPAVQTFVACRPPAQCFPFGGPVTDQFLVRAEQGAPRVQITGVTSTFVIPSFVARRIRLGGEPVIRTELAYFRNEPRHLQSQLDPFIYASGFCPGGTFVDAQGNPVPRQPGTLVPPGAAECTGGRRTGDSWNFVLGVDMNQFIRFLNPRNSFFITTQFFYKHLNGGVERQLLEDFGILEGEVLPVPKFNQQPGGGGDPVQSILIHHPIDQFLQTLLISTSYRSGTINPSLVLFYDWSGAFVAAPGVTFIRDPFRFRVEYDFLYASRLRGASGTSLLRDRDNVLFQLEYVI